MATKHDLLSTLRSVQAGSISPEEALLQMKLAPFEDLGYAKVDYHRAVRQGASEVIYGQSKTPEHIAGILEAMQRRDSSNILVTRIEQKTADWLGVSPAVRAAGKAGGSPAASHRAAGRDRGHHRRYQRYRRGRRGCYYGGDAGQPRDAAL